MNGLAQIELFSKSSQTICDMSFKFGIMRKDRYTKDALCLITPLPLLQAGFLRVEVTPLGEVGLGQTSFNPTYFLNFEMKFGM